MEAFVGVDPVHLNTCFRCAFSMAEIKAEPKLHVSVVIVEHGLSALLLLSRVTTTLFFCLYLQQINGKIKLWVILINL